MNRTALAAIWPPTSLVAALAGHERMSPVQAIRRKCLDCCGHQLAEVRLCEAISCPLWPFRAGRHPYTRKSLLEADSKVCPSGGSLVPQFCPTPEIGLQEATSGCGDSTSGKAMAVAAHDEEC